MKTEVHTSYGIAPQRTTDNRRRTRHCTLTPRNGANSRPEVREFRRAITTVEHVIEPVWEAL